MVPELQHQKVSPLLINQQVWLIVFVLKEFSYFQILLLKGILQFQELRGLNK